MDITNNKIQSPGVYELEREGRSTLVIKETENVEITGDGVFIDGAGEKQPDISFLKSSDINIEGAAKGSIVLYRTRVKVQGFSKNVSIKNLIALMSHGASFSMKTEWHIDKGAYFADQDPGTFGWEFGGIIDCDSVRPEDECIYIGSQKPNPHYFIKFVIVNFNGCHSGREGLQVANVKDLQIENVSFYDTGVKNTFQQNNGAQISNSHGTIRNMKLEKCQNMGLLIFSFGLTFERLRIKDCQEAAIFIGQVEKRFPGSPLNDGSPIVIEYAEITNCKYAINVQTDEMHVYIIDAIIDLENMVDFFHPDSKTKNVHLINPNYYGQK